MKNTILILTLLTSIQSYAATKLICDSAAAAQLTMGVDPNNKINKEILELEKKYDHVEVTDLEISKSATSLNRAGDPNIFGSPDRYANETICVVVKFN